MASEKSVRGLEMSELEALLKSKIEKINSRKDKLQEVGEWIGDGYRGKIIQLKFGDKAYHIVFTRDSVSLREGEYPSVEVTYYASEDVLLRIIKGETRAKTEIRAGNLVNLQSLHEAAEFEQIMVGV